MVQEAPKTTLNFEYDTRPATITSTSLIVTTGLFGTSYATDTLQILQLGQTIQGVVVPEPSTAVLALLGAAAALLFVRRR